MENFLIQKKLLRRAFSSKRTSLRSDEVRQESRKINQNFLDNLLPKIYCKKSNQTFSLYLPSYNEVSTSLILQHFKKNKIQFCYPKIIQKNSALDFILHENSQSFAKNEFYPKIIEPVDGKKKIPDFLILPLVAFDAELSRLGMGGGFFDRTIENFKNQNLKITTIALAYDFQRHDKVLPTEKTDQKLDFIVTQNFIFCRKSSLC
jgi:5-formyltetrahydrofolate cyclo-ligase